MKRQLFWITLVGLIVLIGGTLVVGAEETSFSDKQYTYSFASLYSGRAEDDARIKYIEEKFNVKFEFIPMSMNDWDQKLRLWLASGDMPDVVQMKFSPSHYTRYKEYVEQGLLRKFPELNNKYPNLQKIKDKMEMDDKLYINGNLYGWPSYNSPVGGTGWLYRRDWAEELDVAQPDDVYTLKEFLILLEAFKEEKNTLGAGCIGWAYPQYMYNRIAPQGTGIYKKEGKYVWGAAQPDMVKAIRFAKDNLEKGLFWQEQMLAKNKDAVNNYIAGKMGALYFKHGVNQMTKDVGNPMLKAFPDLNIEKAVRILYLKDDQGKLVQFAQPDFWTLRVYAPDISDSKMERLLYVWDYIASDEGYMLMNAGFEGKDYIKKENGEIKLLYEKDDKGNYINPYPNDSVHFFNAVQLKGKYLYKDPSLPKWARLAMKERDEKFDQLREQGEVNYYPYDYKLSFWTGEKYVEWNNQIGSQIEDKITEILATTSSPEEAVKTWKKYVKSMMPQVQPVLDELNNNLLDN